MSKNNRISKKTKIIIYISCGVAAVIAAVGAVFLVLHMFGKEVPAYSYISTVSEELTQEDYDIVEIVEPEENKENVSQEEKPEDPQEKPPKEDSSKPDGPDDTVKIDTSGLTKHKVKLSVSYLSQNPELPAGCEITALTTVLNYLGYDVSKLTMCDVFLEKSNTVDDFYKVYVGNPKSNGFGCYAQPITDAANKYLKTQDSNYKAVNLSGEKFEKLLAKVQNGTPVIIWSTMYSKKTQTLLEPYVSNEWKVGGQTIKCLGNEHCMVLIGYDIDRNVAIMSDPLRGIVEYDLKTVKERYISMHSQCVVLQPTDTAPIINGVTDGECYYTTQYVTVDDENLLSVTLNGKSSESKFYIGGNNEASYKIIATDTAKNKTEVTIYTKPIASISESISDLTKLNVTTDNRDTVNSIRDIALGVTTDYATKQEKQELELIITNCDDMLDKIVSVSAEYDRIAIAVSDYEEETPLAEDRDIITTLITDIDDLLFTSNITELQRTALQGFKSRCEELLSQIPPTEDEPPHDENERPTDDDTSGEQTPDIPQDENEQPTDGDDTSGEQTPDIPQDENQNAPDIGEQDPSDDNDSEILQG